MFRLRIESVHFNGGFGRAGALTPADVLASRAGEEALTEAEERLIAEVNGLGATVLAQIAGHKATRPVWRAIGLDGEGLDLAAGGRAARASSSVSPPMTRRRGGPGSKSRSTPVECGKDEYFQARFSKSNPKFFQAGPSPAKFQQRKSKELALFSLDSLFETRLFKGLY